MPPADRYVSDLSSLLKDATLDQIGAEILCGEHRALRYRETRREGKSMVFVARHNDVKTVLTEQDEFSLWHYNPLYSAIAPPGAFVVMRPAGPMRAERLAIMEAASRRTPWFGPDAARRRELTRECTDHVLADTRNRPFDLICEYGYFVPYLMGKQVLGLTGPRILNLLSILVGALNHHTIYQLLGRETGPYLTAVACAQFPGGQLLLNFENRMWYVEAAARYGASTLRKHIERQVDATPRNANNESLLNALLAARNGFPKVPDVVYREHVVSILMELWGTLLVFPGLGFTNIIERWLTGLGLEDSLRQLKGLEADEAESFVQEQLRLAPPSARLLRNATRSLDLGGLMLEAGEYVCVLIKSAGTDIPNPQVVETGRCPSTYLHFGPAAEPRPGPHRCFAHWFAPSVLAELFLGLTRLPGLALRSGLTKTKLVPGRLMVEVVETGSARP